MQEGLLSDLKIASFQGEIHLSLEDSIFRLICMKLKPSYIRDIMNELMIFFQLNSRSCGSPLDSLLLITLPVIFSVVLCSRMIDQSSIARGYEN